MVPSQARNKESSSSVGGVMGALVGLVVHVMGCTRGETN